MKTSEDTQLAHILKESQQSTMKGQTMIDHYLGVDLHGKRSYLVLMNADGVIEDKRLLSNADVSAYINQLPYNTHAVLEATGNWSFMYNVLSQRFECVELAHPQQIRAIAAARIKNDRIDATILAHLARTDLLPTAYAAPVSTRSSDTKMYHGRVTKQGSSYL